MHRVCTSVLVRQLGKSSRGIRFNELRLQGPRLRITPAGKIAGQIVQESCESVLSQAVGRHEYSAAPPQQLRHQTNLFRWTLVSHRRGYGSDVHVVRVLPITRVQLCDVRRIRRSCRNLARCNERSGLASPGQGTGECGMRSGSASELALQEDDATARPHPFTDQT